LANEALASLLLMANKDSLLFELKKQKKDSLDKSYQM
jgi:hypothetical protein